MAKHVTQNMTAEELEIILSRTEKEINEIKMADCIYCRYFSGRKKQYVSQGTCEYGTIVGHSRPCLAGDCRQAGVWEEKQKNKKTKPIRIKFWED